MRRQLVWFLAGSCLMAIGGGLGYWAARDRDLHSTAFDLHSTANFGKDWEGPFQQTLHAATASGGENFALATGAVDEDAEGIFVVDFATGILQCAVLNHRSGKFAALFQTNVAVDLGASKNSKFQLVTGNVNFSRGSSSVFRPGMSVVYVLDSSSGNLVAYGIPWQREAAVTGRPQLGTLVPIDTMKVRTIPLREP